MAFVTKSDKQNSAAETSAASHDAATEEVIEEALPVAEEKERKGGGPLAAPARAAVSSGGSGFFTIYKKGQGYWTRMGTAIGIASIAAFTAYNLYYYVPTFLTSMSDENGARVGVAIGIVTLLLIAGIGYWLMNKPGNADFLIATDSEMKKVNWTSKRELIGSTKVVILFMFVVTVFLFTVDIIFGYLFHIARVLESGPFSS